MNTKSTNTYDDDNIPNVDLPKNKNTENVEPLPESTRPRKDGPGGENGDWMIDNHELPIGFTMELAQHSDILNKFAGLSKEEQAVIIDGAKQTSSRSEMRHYVENMFR